MLHRNNKYVNMAKANVTIIRLNINIMCMYPRLSRFNIFVNSQNNFYFRVRLKYRSLIANRYITKV